MKSFSVLLRLNTVFLFLMLCLNISGAEERIPVTGNPFGDATGDIQFVVMSDRTGGMRPGVFRDAIEKVNLLHPQFVISVGD
jgi:hypothetical protein